MAIQWGTWVMRDAYYGQRVGIDLTLSGTQITARYYVETTGSIAQSARALSRSGAVTGNVNYAWSRSNAGVNEITAARATKNGARGSSHTFGASFPLFWGGTARVSGVSVTIPALVPANPGAPNVTGIGTSGCNASVGAPANNGSGINLYEWQWATNSGFTAGTGTATSTGPSRSFTGFAANTTYWLRARARNGVGYSGRGSARSFKTKPLSPAAPTAATVSRVSDTSHTIKWNRNASTGAPWDNVIVRRWDNVANAWATIAPNLAGTATSYTDNSTRADRRYQYQVQSRNAAGTSSAASTGFTVTTPADPTNARARKDGQNIIVDFTPKVSYGAQHEIWHLPSGGTWALLTTLAQGVTLYTHQAPSNLVTHQYRVRAKSAGPVLYSNYATTAVVQLAAAPNAPTVAATIAGDIDFDYPITSSWTHNPVDSSVQSKSQVRARLKGTTTWTEDPITQGPRDTIEWVPGLPYINGETIEWQVRTWGVHANPSNWSATATVQFSSRPTVFISEPVTGIYHYPTLTVEWVYYQSEGQPQSQWRAELINSDGDVVQTQTGSGITSAATFTRVMPDQTEWAVQVTVRSGAGLWSDFPDATTFHVDYPEPATPIVGPVYDPETGTVEIGVENPEPLDDQPETVYNAVYRSINGGEPVLIASDVPVNGVITDSIPSLAGTNVYTAVAWSELPSTAESEPVAVAISEPGWVYVNYGDNFADFVRLYGNVKLSGDTERPRTMHRFAGRRRPVAFFGEGGTQSVKVAGRLTPDASTLHEWEAAALGADLVCFRDPKGRRIFGVLGQLTHAWETPTLVAVGFDVEEVDHGE